MGASFGFHHTASSPGSHQHNVLIEQASDGMITGKIPLGIHSMGSAHDQGIFAALTSNMLRQPGLSSVSFPHLKSKAVDCLSDRPTKKPRLDPLPKHKKTARFVTDESKLYEMIPITQGEEYDCEARWYSRSEYNSFRQDMKMNFFMHSLWMRNVEQQQQEDMQPPKDLCIRGLEKFCFYSNQAAMKDMRLLRLQAVLDQQRIQKAVGTKDPMTTRVVAEILSQRVAEQALQRGAEDCEAACNP